MPEKEMTEEKRQLSRRQFIRNAGIVVGGTAVGSSILLSACGEDVTTTVTKTETVTTDVAKYVSPFDGQEFDTLAALEAHITDKYLEDPDVIEKLKYVDPFTGEEFDSLAALKTHIEENYIEVAPAEPIEGLVEMTVNGKKRSFVDLKPYSSLMFVLREKLGLFGTKDGCSMGECGTCTVIMNGKTVYSCLALAVECDGAEIETIEAQSDGVTLNAAQQKLYEQSAVQCGYCVPGIVMSATSLMRNVNNPTLNQIKEAISGHQCTCGNLNVYLQALAGLDMEVRR